MKTVAMEDLYIGTILTFCENAVKLGCPKDVPADVWFRNLPYEEQFKLADKMMDIEAGEESEAKEEVEDEGKIVLMRQIQVDLSYELKEKLCEIARREIVEDEEALLNYATNKAIKEMLDKSEEN